jgi:sulfite exporter TauE/SafE
MCGPLVCARLGSGAGLRRPGIWLYNAGRAVSYPAVGALAGGLGGGLARILAPFGTTVSVALATLLFVAAILVFCGRGELLTRAAGRMTARWLGPATRRPSLRSPAAQMLALGAVTATLPCMTLTPVVLLAAGAGSALKGAALLFAFYGGTLPVMVIAPTVPARLEGLLPPGAARIAAGLFLLFAGFTSLIRALN